MKVSLYSNEFPPHVYGGAGVHIDFLSRELQKLCEVDVRCFGEQNIQSPNLNVLGVQPHLSPQSHNVAHSGMFKNLSRNLEMSLSTAHTDVVHCHTWYSHFAGVLTKTLHQVPLILTTHSLEPHRPWKVEQLGNGYHLSCWVERTAYQNADGIIAVSNDMKKDVIEAYGVEEDRVRVIHNGIDLNFYQPIYKTDVLESLGIDPYTPYVLFVGRITRQKGIAQLLAAAKHINSNAQIVLCAGAPDTPEIEKETQALFQDLSAHRDGVILITEMLKHDILRVLYSHAAVFVCPSLYEPFGIINLEAMACGTPVVASRVGGIPEIIVEGETGYLVDLESVSKANFEPKDPDTFQRNLAAKVNILLEDEAKRTAFGAASRKRVEQYFGWEAIAKQTLAFYEETMARAKTSGLK